MCFDYVRISISGRKRGCQMSSGEARPHIRYEDNRFCRIEQFKKLLAEACWGDGYGSTTCHMSSGEPRPHIRPKDNRFGRIVRLKKVLVEAGWGDGYVQCGLKQEASQPQGLDANSAS